MPKDVQDSIDPDKNKNAAAANIGKGLDNAADANDQAQSSAYAKHSAGTKSYAAELGDAMAQHAQGQGERWPEAKGGKPNPGTGPDKRLKENKP